MTTRRKNPENVRRGRRNKRRGDEGEREARQILLAAGYLVARSTRSQGPYDIIAWNDKHIRLIQIKRQKTTFHTKPRHLAELREAIAPRNRIVIKELWVRVDRQGWSITEVKP